MKVIELARALVTEVENLPGGDTIQNRLHRVVINHPTTGLHNIGGIQAETHDGETVIVIHVVEAE